MEGDSSAGRQVSLLVKGRPNTTPIPGPKGPKGEDFIDKKQQVRGYSDIVSQTHANNLEQSSQLPFQSVFPGAALGSTWPLLQVSARTELQSEHVLWSWKNSEGKSRRCPVKCSIQMLLRLCELGPSLQSEAVSGVSKDLVTPNYKRWLKKDGRQTAADI